MVVTFTETKMSSFWRNFHHWLHCKLSFWQLSVQPVMKISSKWGHFRFSVGLIKINLCRHGERYLHRVLASAISISVATMSEVISGKLKWHIGPHICLLVPKNRPSHIFLCVGLAGTTKPLYQSQTSLKKMMKLTRFYWWSAPSYYLNQCWNIVN